MVGAIRVHNRRGEWVDAPQYTATEAKHKFGQLLDSALREGPVAIIKQRKPAAMLISLDQYLALTQAEDRALAALSAEFDRQFSQMQAPAAAAAMQRAFDTPPAQLGVFAAASMQTQRAGAKAPAKKRARSRRG
jgi:prevent-host-death family protein